jgi:heme exporter protein C
MWAIFHKLGSPPWLYRLSGQILRWLLPITVVALAVGLTWGLLYTAPDFRQGNSYRIIYIHVPAAVVALAGYYVMALAGAISLIWKMKMADIAMQAAAPVGAALTFIALVTGSIWGKPTWGTWWVWDARITSMLILLFLYLGVIALYEAYDNKAAAARACAVLALVGTVNIPIIYKSVDWWYSLHQPASIKFTGSSSIDPSMLYPCSCVSWRSTPCSPVSCLPTCVSLSSTGSGARPGCSASRPRAPDVLRVPVRSPADGRARCLRVERLRHIAAGACAPDDAAAASPAPRHARSARRGAPRAGQSRSDNGESLNHASASSAAPLGGAQYRAVLQCSGGPRGLRPARQHQSLLPPVEVAAGEAPLDTPIRVGGMVVDGSVQRADDSLEVRFQVTDYQATVDVVYVGILPDLFAEGEGAVASGRLGADGVLRADEVLAKHDENYMPPEVAEALGQNPTAAAR